MICKLLKIIIITPLLISCTMIPKLPKTYAAIPKNFPSAGLVKTKGPIASEIPWRDYFVDAQLRDVISLALTNNRDLRVAALNIEKARAQYQIQGADLFPTIGGSFGQNAHRLPNDALTGMHKVIKREFTATLDLAGYEFDFFGRIRSLKAQAFQNYLSTEEARRSAQISLIAEVANAWLRLAANNERLILAQKTYRARQKAFKLIRSSFKIGIASEIDLRQAETLMEGARADVAYYTTLVVQDKNALALLVGANVPVNLFPSKISSKLNAVDEIPAGLSSEVLTRRPDILQAERALRAANANIGAARAAFFPRITITVGGGVGSTSLENLFAGDSSTWRFMPQLYIPIFEGGKLKSNLKLAEVQRDINVALYEKAIQRAFREVADALAERASIKERLDARRKLVRASSTTFRLTEARYEEGIDNYLIVIDSERTFYSAQLELINVHFDDASNRVILYKVLGGGVR